MCFFEVFQFHSRKAVPERNGELVQVRVGGAEIHEESVGLYCLFPCFLVVIEIRKYGEGFRILRILRQSAIGLLDGRIAVAGAQAAERGVARLTTVHEGEYGNNK